MKLIANQPFIKTLKISLNVITILALTFSYNLIGVNQAQAVGSVTGRVLAGGAPVPDGKVNVGIGPEFQPPLGSTGVGPNGNFTVGNLPAGTYVLQTMFNDPSLDGYMPTRITGVTVSDGVTTNLGDIALTPTTKTVTGKVTRVETGAGVSGAQINAFEIDGGFLNKNVTTASNGSYTLKLIGGRWGINVSGGYDQFGNPIPVDWVYQGQPIDVSFNNNSSSESKTMDIQVLTANSTVKGKILFPNGSAASLLNFELRGSSGGIIQGQTKQDGTFTVNVSAGSYELNGWLPPDKQQFAFPTLKFSIDEKVTKDLGTITLTQKNSQIKGKVTDESGNGLANINVNAFAFESPSFSFTQTAADGTYLLHVSAGRLGVDAHAPPDSPYVSAERNKEISINDNETKTGVDFKLIKADVTINGQVTDPNGTVLTNFFGWADAHKASTGPGPGGLFFGGPINQGLFTIRVASKLVSELDINVWTPPESTYSSTGPVKLTIAANQTYNVKVKLAPNDTTVVGKLVNQDGKTITGVEAEVFAMNPEANIWRNGRVNPADGTFTLSLRSGKYLIGAWAFNNPKYLNQPPEFGGGINIPAGTTTYNVALQETNATISGKLLDPSGNTIKGIFGFVFAHQDFDEVEENEFPIDTGGEIRSDGTFNFGVVAENDGTTYFIGAGLPPEAASNWMPPKEVEVTVKKGDNKTVTLQFKEADGNIKGKVIRADGGSVEFGYCWGWSETGSNSGTPVFGGNFSLPVTANDRWHVGCDTFDGTTHYSSGEVVIRTLAGTGFTINRNFILEKGLWLMPEPVCETFDSSQPKTINLSNGAVLTAPSQSFATSGNVTVCVKPDVNLKREKNTKIVSGFGYDLTATAANGTEISEFNSAIIISFPIDHDALSAAGLEPNDLLPAFYDSAKGTWEKVTNAVITEDQITFTTTHFTSFALTSGGSLTVTSATASLLALPRAGGGPQIQMYNNKLEYVGGFFAYAPGFRGGVNAISADLDKDGTDEIATVPAGSGGPHLRVFDKTGALLAETFVTSLGYRGGFQIAVGDVDGDGINEIVLGTNAGGTPQVIVYSYADGTLTKNSVFSPYNQNFRQGIQIAVGDVDGDKTTDIITAPNAGGGPHVRVFNSTGKAMSSFFAYQSHLRTGVYLSLGDVDGDGTLDIITTPGKGSPANVASWSYTGTLKSSFFALPKTNTDGVKAQAANVDGDKTMEIVVTPLEGSGPQVSIFDYLGNVESRFFAYQSTLRTGVNAVVHDVDNDGTMDIITAPGKGGGPLVSKFNSSGTAQKRFFSHHQGFRGGLWLTLGND